VISVMSIPLQSLSLVFQMNSSIKFMQLLLVIVLWGPIISLSWVVVAWYAMDGDWENYIYSSLITIFSVMFFKCFKFCNVPLNLPLGLQCPISAIQNNKTTIYKIKIESYIVFLLFRVSERGHCNPNDRLSVCCKN
jgi:hypothetical protein